MIYFMRRGTAEDAPIKIGYSDNVMARRAVIAYTLKVKVTILGVMDGSRPEEATLHKRFALTRIKGTEWFTPSPELLEFIASKATEYDHSGQLNLETVKMDRTLAGMAKLIAVKRGIPVAELLDELLDGPLNREYARVMREAEEKGKP